MIGAIILSLSILLYFQPKHRYLSYFLYIGFMTGYQGGYGILTDEIIGIKNMDLAIIYSFIISFYLFINKKINLPNHKFVKYMKIFLFFMLISSLYSFFHYGFSPYQILQGGRKYLLVLSIPILLQIKSDEVFRILKIWIPFVTISSVVYILQLVFSTTILPYSGTPLIDSSTGLIRVYNSPFGLAFFLSLTFLCPQYFKYNINIYRCIFFMAIMCTLGRTGIFTSILTVFISIVLVKGASKLIKVGLIMGIFILPFIGTISNRLEEGGTSNDLQQILNGKFNENYESSGDATMTYRFAWIYERVDYLLNRSLGEQIFGLGLISDSQPIVHKIYNFKLGLFNEETNNIEQLNTPDIAYGNIISQLGFAGGFIYLLFIINLTSFYNSRKKYHPIIGICFSIFIISFIEAFAGSRLSTISSFSYLFIFLSLSNFKLKTNNHYESNTH